MSAQKRAMSSAKASAVKRQGHEDAREFAIVLGIGKEFRSDPRAKKDVIDEDGFSYSVKSGKKKWQIFLYGEKRFEENSVFKGMFEISEIFLSCIRVFPEKREEYIKNKILYKEKLKKYMQALANLLKRPKILEAFLDKAIFNSGEVNFLVVKDDQTFHVFWCRDVVKVLSESYNIETSKARRKGQLDDQKVLFRAKGVTHGEIEMRNDSEAHYREVKFWLSKPLTFNLLKEKIKESETIGRIVLYGEAIKRLKKKIKNRN